MPYITLQDLIDRYGEVVMLGVADRDSDGEYDTDAVDRAITDASETIDSYLAKRYALPLPSIPAPLKRICGDIVLYLLSSDGTVTDEKRKRYEDAINFLKALAKGDASLGAALEQDSNNNVGQVEMTSSPRLFSRNTMRSVT